MSERQAQILVVDDEQPAREALSFNLTRAGYEPVEAEDGVAAWSRLEGEPDRWDAILLDRAMPRMGGMELLRRVKEHPQFKVLPVIMQTAQAAPEDVQAGLDAGAHYYLTKPFSRKTLLAIVRTAVADSLQHRELREKARRTMGSFGLLQHATYVFRTLEEAKLLAALLSRCSPEPETVVVGLSELLVNAVEHGNLGITYDDKTRLLEEDAWAAEVERRLDLPEHRHKRVTVEMERTDGAIRYEIEDQGEGFDWKSYVEISPERAFHSHGRGIAMSRGMSFDSVEFLGNGSRVRAIKHVK